MRCSTSILTRFWRSVDVRGDDDCWPWKLSCYHDGYGLLAIRNQGRNTTMRASAFSLTVATAEQANGRFALHTCDNPPCCNPSHLYWGDQKQNMDDMGRRGRRVRKGSPGEQHPNSKLTASDVIAIRDEWARGGISQQKIADRYGVTQVSVSSIVRRKTWSHL